MRWRLGSFRADGRAVERDRNRLRTAGEFLYSFVCDSQKFIDGNTIKNCRFDKQVDGEIGFFPLITAVGSLGDM